MNNDKNTYYCGAWWTPKLIRRILSIRFNASCKVHDLDYKTTRFTREEADARFLLHMLRQAKGSMFWKMMANLFYFSVRILGKLSYGMSKTKKAIAKKLTIYF